MNLIKLPPINTSFFFGAGLSLPLDPLVVEFLTETRFHIYQLTPNIIRILLGASKLNRRFVLHLVLNEIKYCYSLGIFEDKWNLRVRPHSPSLVEGLTFSHKGYYNDVIIITGVLDPTNKPMPKQFGTPGVWNKQQILFYLLFCVEYYVV